MKNLIGYLWFFGMTLKVISQDTLSLVSGYVDYLGGSSPVTFSLTFNRAPDFFTVNSFNYQADSFRFQISTNREIPMFNGLVASTVEGGDIHISGEISIRDPKPDPWNINGPPGELRGVVPYSLIDSTITFSVPADILNVEDQFGYRLSIGNYFFEVNSYSGMSGGPIAVPEPSKALLVLAGLILSCWCRSARC